MPTITTTDYLLDQAKRTLTTSPLLTLPGMGLVEKRLLARDWPQHPMAQPPAGSGLHGSTRRPARSGGRCQHAAARQGQPTA